MLPSWTIFALWAVSTLLVLGCAWWCYHQLRQVSRLLTTNRTLTRSFASNHDHLDMLQTLCRLAQRELAATGVTLYLQNDPQIGFERAAESGRSAEETGPGLVRDLLIQANRTGQTLESQYGGRSIVAAPLQAHLERSSKLSEGPETAARHGAFLVVWDGTHKLSAVHRQLLEILCGFALLTSAPPKPPEPTPTVALDQAQEQIKSMQQELVEEHHLASVGRLAAGVAHELNTPLGAVLTMVSSLQRNEADKARSKKLQIIRDAVEKSKSIIEKLLVYSRDPVETENGLTFSRFVRADASINQVIESALELMAESLDSDGIQTQAELAPIPPLRINSTQFGSIISNLISNARDALKSSGTVDPKIFVKTFTEGDKVILEFADNGPGIPDDIRKKVFQPFFTTKDIGKGTGLGLAIVSETVRKHQGQVQVLQRQGGGALFRITLPLSANTTEG